MIPDRIEDSIEEDGLSLDQLLYATVNGISDAVFVVTLPDREIVMCNRAVSEVFGYPREELIGRTTEMLHVDEESAKRFGRECEDALRERRYFRTEYRAQRADGSTFPTEHSVGVIGDMGDGRPNRVVSVVRDLSTRKRHEETVELVQRTGTAIAGAESFDAALDETLRRLGRHIDWQYGEAWRPPEIRGEDGGVPALELQATWISSDDHVDGDLHRRIAEFDEASWDEQFSSWEGLPGRAWSTKESIWLESLADTAWYRRREPAREAGLRSALAIPVTHGEKPVAILVWYASRAIDRNTATVELAETITEQLSSFLYRREIEDELRRERNRFETVTENIAEVLWMSTPDKSEILYVNAAYEEVWGRAPETLLANPQSWLDGVHPEDRDRVREAAQHQMEGDYDEVYRIVRPDGEIRWIRDRAYPVGAGDGARLVGLCQDITERRRAEKKLRDSREKFSTAFEANPLGMAIATLDGRTFVDVNESFCELTGYERDELLGAPVAEFDLWADPADKEEVQATMDARGEIRDYETQLRRADGELRNVLLAGETIEIDGTPCILSATRDVTSKREYESRLEHNALHDILTGLPNQILYRDRLEQALKRRKESGEELAVVFVDIARFRVVNDTLGHSAGDELLELVAERLTDCVDSGVTVARFGSDEFVLLVENVESLEVLEETCEDWLDAVRKPCEIGGTVIHPELSAGIATSGPEARTADDLLRYADLALSKAKSEQGTSISHYEPEHDTESARQLHRENALRRAVERREFVLRYQPVVDLETERVIGAESLVRWDHPEHGIISPGEFIPLAEETGLIVPMGYQVLEMAMSDAAGWLEQYPSLQRNDPAFRLAVNLSARQYRTEKLTKRIRTLTEQTGFPLEQLVLEVTESILITGHGKLERLRDDGVRVAIDDFGTGYSSLQYLRRLEADALKIDRSFVKELDEEGREEALVRAILGIAEEFGLSVVAEGIETEQQLRHLVEIGGRLGQGYHFARPMSADDFESEYFTTD